jgi:gamma-glutamylcyclotransferase (GGCT)/AIG2-like uncharacterized protein YtfP
MRTTAAMVRMFFYGVFKQGSAGERPGMKYIGRQHLDGWTLHGSGVAHAHVTDEPGAYVEGDVYDVPEDAVEGFFDRVEGHPHPGGYRRVGAVTREGDRVNVYMGSESSKRYPVIGPRWERERFRAGMRMG